jgi:hypothetical protein
VVPLKGGLSRERVMKIQRRKLSSLRSPVECCRDQSGCPRTIPPKQGYCREHGGAERDRKERAAIQAQLESVQPDTSNKH